MNAYFEKQYLFYDDININKIVILWCEQSLKVQI